MTFFNNGTLPCVLCLGKHASLRMRGRPHGQIRMRTRQLLDPWLELVPMWLPDVASGQNDNQNDAARFQKPKWWKPWRIVLSRWTFSIMWTVSVGRSHHSQLYFPNRKVSYSNLNWEPVYNLVSAKFGWLDRLEYCSQFYTTEGISTIVDLKSTCEQYREVGWFPRCDC